jgi:protein-disulfide isomerase
MSSSAAPKGLQGSLRAIDQYLPAGMSVQNLTRRHMIYIGAAGVALAAASAWALNSSESTSRKPSRKRIDEVPVAELMKPGPLPDLQVGKDDAPITIVEYASMTCSHCAHFHNTVYPTLKTKYLDTGKARLIIREFPLDERATAGAMLARCTGEGKTVPAISALFGHQDEWAFTPKEEFMPGLTKFAKQIGFTEDTMRACLKDEALMDKVLQVRSRAADEFGVGSTPTFFINGKRLPGGAAIEDFDKAFEPLLKS